ncbi:MAG: DUF4412 domain-containing protein [Pelobium sp.]
MGSSFVALAQKTIKSGTITYAVEFQLPPDQQAMAAMLPSEYKVAFDGEMSKFKLDMGMFSTQVIYNAGTNESLSLTEVPIQSKKIAVKMTSDQTNQMQEMQSGEKDFEVKATSETKKIGVYNCTKYILTDKISGDKTEVWTTNEITIPKNSLTTMVKDVKGFPVAFESSSNGMKVKMNLKQVKEEEVPAITFDVPSDYEVLSFDSMLQMMGGR